MMYIVAGSFKPGLYWEVFPYLEVCYSEVLLYQALPSGPSLSSCEFKLLACVAKRTTCSNRRLSKQV